MASIYTHHHLNASVYPFLPEEAKGLIGEHREYYQFGAQGPDLFFFQMSSVKKGGNLGERIHNKPFIDFWKPVEKYSLEKGPLAAYLIGCSLHFLVDVTIHPTVDASIEEGYGHIDIETELDRYYMEKDGYKATKFKQWELIAKSLDADVILKAYSAYPSCNYDMVKESIRDFRRVKRVLHSPNVFTEKALFAIMKKMKFHKYIPIITKQRPMSQALKTNRILRELIETTKVRAPEYIREVLNASRGGSDYPEEFFYNFNGRKA